MRRLAVLAAAAMLAAAAASADAAAPAFRYGVAAGEITATSAILWTRAPGPGAVTGPGLAESLACRESARDCQGDALGRSHALNPGSRAQPRLALLLRIRPGPVPKPSRHLRHRAAIDHERERSLRDLR